MDRYDRMANSMPWHDPEFREAARQHEQREHFLRLCKKADEQGRELTATQKRLRKMFEGKQ